MSDPRLTPFRGRVALDSLRGKVAAEAFVAGTPMQVAARLPAGTVIVIDDLDLWWERRPGGLEAIEELLDVVATTGDRVGFVLGGGTHAVRLIDALRPLTRVAYLQVGCAPLTARQLDQVVMARHGSTGLRLKVGQRVGDAIGPWSRARLFDAHFDYSHGNVGYALRAWVAHVDALADEVLAVRTPAPLDWDALDDLRPELVAVLLELLLHKQVTADKLARVTGRPIGDLRDVLAELVGVGLATQNRRRVVQLNPFVHVPVVDWLRRRELT